MIILGVILIPDQTGSDGNLYTKEAIRNAFERGIKTPFGTKAVIIEEDAMDGRIPKGSLVLVSDEEQEPQP